MLAPSCEVRAVPDIRLGTRNSIDPNGTQRSLSGRQNGRATQIARSFGPRRGRQVFFPECSRQHGKLRELVLFSTGSAGVSLGLKMIIPMTGLPWWAVLWGAAVK